MSNVRMYTVGCILLLLKVTEKFLMYGKTNKMQHKINFYIFNRKDSLKREYFKAFRYIPNRKNHSKTLFRTHARATSSECVN